MSLKPSNYYSDLPSEDRVEWGKVGVALLAWSFIALVFAAYFSGSEKSDSYEVHPLEVKDSWKALQKQEGKPQPLYQIGPIVVQRPGETYELRVKSYVPTNRWSFIEVQVLDQQEEYLYSLGNELWHETGRDSDGKWRERKDQFDTAITFPEPGFYYFNFLVDKNFKQQHKVLTVKVSKRNGSSLAHSVISIILLIVGLILIEIQWSVFRKTLEAMNEQN